MIDDADEMFVIGSNFRPIEDFRNDLRLEVAAKKVCKISHKNEITGSVTFATGFLYEMSCTHKEKLYGLFTNCHVFSCKCTKSFPFDLQWLKQTKTVNKEDVKYFFTDSHLDVTFIAFCDEFLMKLRRCGADFLFQHAEEVVKNSKVFAIQHPGGEGKCYTEGKLSDRKFYDATYDIRYAVTTLPGSSGCPILTEEGDVLAIHKSSSIFLDLVTKWKGAAQRLFGEDNVGTSMKDAIEMVRRQYKYELALLNSIIKPEQLPHSTKEDPQTLPQEESAIFPVQHKQGGSIIGLCSLCRVTFLDQEPCGLFTTSHVIDFKANKNFYVQVGEIVITNNNVAWTFSHKQFDVTFIVLDTYLVEKLKVANQYFLPIAEEKLSFPTDCFLLQNDFPRITKGIATECDGIDLIQRVITLPDVEGAVILNKQKQVIGLRKTCSLHHKLGIKITKDSLKTMGLKRQYKGWIKLQRKNENRENMQTDTEKAVCAVSVYKDVDEYGKQRVTGSGFLCEIRCGHERRLRGLFTSTILTEGSDEFKIKFDSQEMNVMPHDILWILPHKDLQISFVVFKNSILQNLKERTFLKVFPEQLMKGSSISVLGWDCHKRDGTVKTFEGADLYHSALTSPIYAGSPIVNENYQVVGIHKGAVAKYRIGVNIKDVVNYVTEYSDSRDETVFKSTFNSIVHVQLDQKFTSTGFLCNLSYPWREPLKGMLIRGHLNDIRGTLTIRTDDGRHVFTIKPEEIPPSFSDLTLNVIFIPFHESLSKQIEEKKLTFLPPCYRDLPSDLVIFLISKQQSMNEIKLGVIKNYEEHKFHYETDAKALTNGHPILNDEHEVVGIHEGTGPLDEGGQPIYYVATKLKEIVDAVSHKFYKLSEWEIVIGPLNGRSPENAFTNYLQEHPYIEFTGNFTSKENRLVIRVRSRGLMDIEDDQIQSEIHAKKYIYCHPGLVWSGGWRMSLMNVDCIGKPDNGLPTFSPNYAVTFYNRSSHGLEVQMENGDTHFSHPRTTPLLTFSIEILPHQQRYVKINLKLRNRGTKQEKEAWFYTWINYSWIVMDEMICRSKEDDRRVVDKFTESEMESDYMRSVRNYKRIFCNQIKSYTWR